MKINFVKTHPDSVIPTRGSGLLGMLIRGTSEQIAVRACPQKIEDELLICDLVHQQPVRRDMAFTASGKVAGQGMIPVLCGQGLPCRQLLDDLRQQRHVITALLRPLHVLLESGGGLYGEHQASSSFIMASASV